MKYTTFKKGGYGTGLITTTGGDVYGRVFLSRDPEGELEAATKHYADLSITTLSASSFTTGKLDPARVPEFTGDIVKASGGLSIGYSDTGISSGTYPKISVDRKGRATGGGSLVESDLPDIVFSKITSGKPTTLAGYGILDALSKTGGTLSGRLTAQTTGDLGESVITKGFVDTSNLGTAAIPLGSIVYKGGKGPFFGFLRANGSMASKTVYENLYTKMGDEYGMQYGKEVGFGKPWQQQVSINTAGDTIGTWSVGTALPSVCHAGQAVVTKNRVYMLSAWDGAAVGKIHTAPINADGTLGTWSVAPPLPAALSSGQSVVTKNRVYLLGGNNGSTSTSAAYTAPINPDGTLGAWTTAPSAPAAVYGGQTFVIKDRAYMLGGHRLNVGDSAIVYTAPINEDGTLGTWGTKSPLPNGLFFSQVILTSSRVYSLGGGYWNGTGYVAIASVYSAPISGGLNDYSSYYDGSVLDVEPTHFRLPDIPQNSLGLDAWIKA